MSEKLKKFFKILKDNEKLKTKVEIKLVYVDPFLGFTLSNPYTPLIDLDEEDLKYFKNKYKSRLMQEMNKNITELKSEYNELLQSD